MSTHVIPSPSVPQHRSRTWFVAAVALVVGLGVGAAIVAITETDSSTSSRASSRPVAAPVTAVNTTCPGDSGYLLAEFSAMPTADASRIAGELSTETRSLLRSAALASAQTSTNPARPDPRTLAAALSRVGTHDATTFMSAVAPDVRAVIGSIPTTPQGCSSL